MYYHKALYDVMILISGSWVGSSNNDLSMHTANSSLGRTSGLSSLLKVDQARHKQSSSGLKNNFTFGNFEFSNVLSHLRYIENLWRH